MDSDLYEPLYHSDVLCFDWRSIFCVLGNLSAYSLVSLEIFLIFWLGHLAVHCT